MRGEPPHLSRRRVLKFAAAGLSVAAMPGTARAQLATQAPPKRAALDEHSVTAPVAIEVNARPIAAFDPRDPQRLRFGALEYRGGLVLTSRFPGFGGLSAWRWLDTKGERFISVSDKGSWFTGRILYRGREMSRARRRRGRTAARARRPADHRARLVRFGGDRARRQPCLCRAGARQPGAALRFQQGLYARARRGGAAAAGGAQIALQQGAGSAGRWCRKACRLRAR